MAETPSATTRPMHLTSEALETAADGGAKGGKRLLLWSRRAIGLALVALGGLPVYRLLDPTRTGIPGTETLKHLELVSALVWSGTALALIPLVLLFWLGRDLPLGRWSSRAGDVIGGVRTVVFATFVALLAATLALAFGQFVLAGQPNNIDAIAQLVQARYLSEGLAAGPTRLAEFFVFPNTVLTDRGWVSQYPPAHAALLAIGMRLGVVSAIGPLLLGLTLFFTALTADELLPRQRVATRFALVLAAVSPFLVAHAGAYMNHTSAAAFIMAALYAIVRARGGSLSWSIAAGAAASVALAIRPLSALVIIAAVAATVWGSDAIREQRVRGFVRRAGWAIAGALPITLLHLAYNAYYFGAPLRLGYVAAYGPAHQLGFGSDPWGNSYGLREAVAYTSSDLTALGAALFETPLPLIAICGLYLIIARRLELGERAVLAAALAPVVANFFYWHHGLFMGPRMLNEAAPVWALLVAVAVWGLLARVPERLDRAGRSFAPRAALVGALVLAAATSQAFMTPRRLLSYGGDYHQSLRARMPEAAAPAVVFVHGPWVTRVGSRLTASGMRPDSMGAALRQNTTCSMEQYADARETEALGGRRLDHLRPPAQLPPTLEISPGNSIRFLPGETFAPRCIAHMRADERGVLELAPLLWQGTLPGTSEGGVLLVRDHGPERNGLMLAAVPERTAWLLASRDPESLPELMPYEEGMRLIWGHAADAERAEAAASR